MAGRCSLCGSRLNNGVCEFCGLNNKMYDREYMKDPYHMQAAGTDAGTQKSTAGRRRSAPQQIRGLPGMQKTAGDSRQRQPFSANSPRRNDHARSKSPASRTAKYRAVTLIIVLVVIIFMFAPVLFEIGRTIFDSGSSSEGDSWLTGIEDIFSDDSEDSWSYDDYDPYTYVTREIPETGSTYETTIGDGIYQVGIHLPEGIYHVELTGEGGSLQISDAENLIYESVWFGEDEEYDEVMETDDLRLYNGAEISISGGALLSFSTSNAQPLVQETTANPLTEPVAPDEGTYTVGDGIIAEGIYDVILEETDSYTSFSLDLTYPNGSSEYLWTYYDSGFSEGRIRNIILPAGTEIIFSGDPVEFVPSEGYFEVDYAEYPQN